MNLQQISLDQLKTTTVNVRKKGGKDIADLLPSIRSLGLLQPLLVRPNCEGFEIVAGQRRYHALCALAAETDGTAEPVPCIVMEDGEDARAIEASLAENLARLPMDEIDQYRAFAALVKQGLDAEEIAARFGVTERLVRQRLAIANLYGPILTAYRRGEVDGSTVRLLTMATTSQQKAWWKLHTSEDEWAPTGYQLKNWLFGGAQIPTDNALFDLSDYPGAIIGDLFGEEKYFGEAETFWTHQNAAIAAAKERYLADGWSDVIVLDIGEHFPAYDHVDTAKEDGGKVFVTAGRDGAVTFYVGQLSRKDIRAREKAKESGETDEAEAVNKPELTKAMQKYLDLHRHSAVRTALLADSGIALRLVVAQIIAGSDLWAVHAEPQKAASEAIAESLATNGAETAFADEREAVRELLGIETGGRASLVPLKGDWQKMPDLHDLFDRLLAMSDEDVMRVLTFVAAETLASGTAMVEALGMLLGVDMTKSWQPDDTFFDLLRDKRAINAMVGEIAGKDAANANIAETAKVQKKIIRNCLDGTRQAEIENWQPRYMAFPMRGYV